MDSLTLILALIGGLAGILAISAYRKDHIEKPNQEKEHLIVQYRANQQITTELINDLTAYAEKNNAWDEILNIGFSVKQYIQALEDSQNNHLSEALLEKTLKLPLSSDNIQSMVRSLETQFNALLEIHTYVKLKLKGIYH